MRLTISYNSNFNLDTLHFFFPKLAYFSSKLTCRLNVDIFRMLFLRKLFKAKRSAVLIYMSQHMCILVSTQPFIFPIKPERFTRGHQLFDHLVILHSASIEILH